MRCTSLMLANSVEVRDSMLYVLGGSPEWWTVPTETGPFVAAVAISLEVERNELDTDQELSVLLEDDQGVLGQANITFRPTRRDLTVYVSGAPLVVNLWARLEGPVRRLGGHCLRLLSEGQELALTNFGIRVA